MTPTPKLNRTVIRDAIIIALDADDRVLDPGDVLIEDGVIALVGRVPSEVDATCDRVIDGRERLVVPGLVNAHTHSPLSVVHGAYDQLNHRASMWLFQAYTARRTPREVYVSALLNCIKMLLSGTTATIDHFPEQAFGPQSHFPVPTARSCPCRRARPTACWTRARLPGFGSSRIWSCCRRATRAAEIAGNSGVKRCPGWRAPFFRPGHAPRWSPIGKWTRPRPCD